MPVHSRVSTIGATEVVELTPVGRGAVAVVLVAGPEALAIVEQCFAAASGRALADVPLQRIVFGRFGGPDGEEVVVCRRSREQIEVHCHGGAAAVSALIGQLVERGCRKIPWQDWLRRTCGDPLTAAAHIALAEAPTARSAAILLDQYHGALTRAVRETLAAIHSENWHPAAQAIESILAHRDAGLHLVTPWRVVLTGPTNVGKSSLINALAGFQRAIVSPLPGTTRDVVTTTTAIDGWPVELADTAGIRNPQNELESAGIELAKKTLADADLLVIVSDSTQPVDAQPEDMLLRMSQRRVVFVLNKIDLLADEHSASAAGDALMARWPNTFQAPRIIRTSAVTGDGIGDLIAAIAQALVPSPPLPGSAVAFTPEQVASLEAARAAVAARNSVASLTALQPMLAHD